MTVADLTYRNYDGPLDSPRRRWWTIARQGMRLAGRKRSLYVASTFSAWYYIVMIIGLFIVSQVGAASPGSQAGVGALVERVVWKDQFLHGFSFGQLILMLVALLLGSGAIANDNRSNALLVYLSKPCTRFDYLIGKWIGIFIPLLIVMAVPTVLFYGYGALSFRSQGFVSDDPWILPKMMLVLTMSALMLSSLVLGVSSLFNQGRIAGATFAGIYLLLSFFTQIMKGAVFFSGGKQASIVNQLFYGSIDGVQIGLAKAILGTDGGPPFLGNAPPRFQTVPAPSLLPMVAIWAGLTALGLFIAYRRIRAVEVVG